MPHILNDAQHAAIGRVATQAARLEAVLEGFLVDALTHDTEVALVAVAGAQFERKTRMLEAILNLRIPTSEDLPAVKELLEEARVVMQERNAFLHGMWQFDADANLQVQNRERRSRKIKVRTVSVGDLNETAKRMTFLADEIEGSWTDLLVDIGAYQALEPGLWQQISPHRPYATEEEKRRPGSFVIALSEADDESPDT